MPKTRSTPSLPSGIISSISLLPLACTWPNQEEISLQVASPYLFIIFCSETSLDKDPPTAPTAPPLPESIGHRAWGNGLTRYSGLSPSFANKYTMWVLDGVLVTWHING